MATTVSTQPHLTTTWWIFLFEGIAAIPIGLLLLTAPPATTVVAISIFFGFYWLFVAVLEFVRIIVDRSVLWIGPVLIGLLGIVAGLLVMNYTRFAALHPPATFVIYLGVLGTVMGIFGVIGGFAGRGIGSFTFGVLNLLIGILLLSSPVAATFAVPFVFGILLLIEGVARIIWAFRIRP